MIEWRRDADYRGVLLTEYLGHHDLLLCVCEAPEHQLGKTSLIDFVVDSPTAEWLSTAEKVFLRFYPGDRRVFLLLAFYPAAEARLLLGGSLRLTTTQWFSWELRVVEAVGAQLELLRYIRAHSRIYRPPERPGLVVEGWRDVLRRLGLEGIAVVNVSSPPAIGEAQLHALARVLREASGADVVLLPLNPLGVAEGSVDPLDAWLWLLSPGTGKGIPARRYASLLGEVLEGFGGTVVAPVLDVSAGELRVVVARDGRVAVYEGGGAIDVDELGGKVGIRLVAGPAVEYRLRRCVIRQGVHVEGCRAPGCLRYVQVVTRRGLVYDSGSRVGLVRF